jgi:hypothetical protein
LYNNIYKFKRGVEKMNPKNYVEKGNYCAYYERENGCVYYAFLCYGTLTSKFRCETLDDAVKTIDDYMKDK